MKVFIEKDFDAVSKKTAEIVADAIKEKPNLIFCLPAGGSPIGMYAYLVRMYQDKEISFKDMITFNMDEYVGLSADNENSYAYFMQKHFLKYVDVPSENAHHPDGMTDDLGQMGEAYSAKMFEMGGLDLAITGIGSNGHIAFNEPAEKLIARTHVVDLDETTIKNNARFFDGNVDLVPKQAISIGMEDIMKSKLFLVIASGKHKAAMIKKTFEITDIDPMWPVSFLRMHPNCIFIIDEDAASDTDIKILGKYVY
jgi:glucosamine-6-phosphate deaminase